MRKKRIRLNSQFLIILILALLLGSCTTQPGATQTTAEAIAEKTEVVAQPVELYVFAAASLSEPFSEIGKKFEADHPGMTVIFNFANSQQLAQQINEGASADVFASANNKQMDLVIQAGSIVSGTQQTFAENRLVAIYPLDNPAGLEELRDLANPGLKLVLAAKEIPIGGYSLELLTNASADPTFGTTFKDQVLENVVSYEDNVKAVLAKVALGEADAGIVYTSDISGRDANKVGWLDIPDALNVVASYPIALMIDSKNPDLAQAFIDLVLSQEGQDILVKYKFIPVK